MSLSVLTLGEALQQAGQGLPRIEARLLLQHVSGLSHSQLIAYPEQRLTAEMASAYEALVQRRLQGEPIAYLLGQREFYGRIFQVAPGVLIPRSDTELLVELGVQKLQCMEAAKPRVLDLGCGSACISISLALECPAAEVTALDASKAALDMARQNALAWNTRLKLMESNWFSALDSESEHFHLIVSNPPYIAADDPHLRQGDLRFEPITALASGADGLADLRQLIQQAPAFLHPGGWLLLEHGHDQAAAVAELLQQPAYTAMEQHRDLAGIIRVSAARRGSSARIHS